MNFVRGLAFNPWVIPWVWPWAFTFLLIYWLVFIAWCWELRATIFFRSVADLVGELKSCQSAAHERLKSLVSGRRPTLPWARPLVLLIGSLFLSVGIVASITPVSLSSQLDRICPMPGDTRALDLSEQTGFGARKENPFTAAHWWGLSPGKHMARAIKKRSGDDVEEPLALSRPASSTGAMSGGRRPITYKGVLLLNPPCVMEKEGGVQEGCPHPRTGMESIGECQVLCSSTPECTGWVYNSLNECFLKGGKELAFAQETWKDGTSWSSAKSFGHPYRFLSKPQAAMPKCTMATWPVAVRPRGLRRLRDALFSVKGVYRKSGRWGAMNAGTKRGSEPWGNTVMISFATADSLGMLSNLHCSIRHHGFDYALGAIGPQAVSWGASHSAATIDLLGLSGLEVNSSSVSCAKLALVYWMLRNRMDALVVDPDVAFVRDPFPSLAALARTGADVLVATGTATRGCLPTYPCAVRQAARERASELFTGSVEACRADAGAVWSHQQLRCACEGWESDPVESHGARPIPTKADGFVNMGFVWLRSRTTVKRLTKQMSFEIVSSDTHGVQQAMHAAMCSSEPWKYDHNSSSRHRLRLGFIDSRVVTIAPVAVGSTLSEYLARAKDAQAASRKAPGLARAFCASVAGTAALLSPYVLHNTWNEPASASAKEVFFRNLAAFTTTLNGASSRSLQAGAAAPDRRRMIGDLLLAWRACGLPRVASCMGGADARVSLLKSAVGHQPGLPRPGAQRHRPRFSGGFSAPSRAPWRQVNRSTIPTRFKWRSNRARAGHGQDEEAPLGSRTTHAP